MFLVCIVITSKVCKYFRPESRGLSDFGGNNYIDFHCEILREL